MRRVREELTRHVGGKPSATQKALIDRAAMLAMHLARMDTRAVQEGGFTDHASREYLAWSNSFTRTMAALGMQAASARAPDIRALMAERAAGTGRAAP